MAKSSTGLLLTLIGGVIGETCEVSANKSEPEKTKGMDCDYGCCSEEKFSFCCERKIGAFIGIIVGSIVLIIVIVIVVYCCCKCKNNKKIRDEQQANANNTSPPGGMVLVPVSYLQQIQQSPPTAGYSASNGPAPPPGYPGHTNYTLPQQSFDDYPQKR
ncbi:uncharacterized protein LOC117339045 [Pecten maximus]|uniref:uncharacterized protein LOC117339045 n=1 Tax=Pecten maximus TaxID=6579 RepID=UPI001458815E|nr:uncharacterized protein LOC117339045 [Pecten maximus]